ncbi:hypothetical protein V8F33_008037 [Rhypophila sp. PSN 637]
MAFRRSHKKSRAGCLECKRRHIKCDEGRPVCRLCTMAERETYCSYGPQVPAARETPSVKSSTSTANIATLMSGSSHESTPSSAETDINMGGLDLPSHHLAPVSSATTSMSATPNSCPYQAPFPAPGLGTLPGEALNMEHMELLVHVMQTKGFFNLGVNIGNYYEQMAIGLEYGLKDPYLIHQFLAYSARHLAHIHPDRYMYYTHQADTHQARAIQLFNLAISSSAPSASVNTQSGAHNPINQSNCVAVVLFSSVLGQTLIAETFDARLHPTFVHPNGDLNAFLTAYTQCLNTFHGVFQIAREAWPLLLTTPLAGYLVYSREFNMQVPRGHHCDVLIDLINTTYKLGKLTGVEYQVCLQMARYLQVGFDAILLPSQTTTNTSTPGLSPESASSSQRHINNGQLNNNGNAHVDGTESADVSPGNASSILIDPRLDLPDLHVSSDFHISGTTIPTPNFSPSTPYPQESGIAAGSGTKGGIDIHALEIDTTDPEMTTLNRSLNKYQMLSAFTMLSPQEYSTMLEHKRPEALVILAYYALLLHYGRHMWQVGDSGRVILGMVSEYLGEEWRVWIGGPLGVVFDGTSPTS